MASIEAPAWLQLRGAPVATALLVICGLVFAVDLVGHRALAEHMLLFGPFVAAGQWWRLITNALAHGGALHILFNGMAVVNLGMPIERGLGSKNFAIVSLGALFGATAAVLLGGWQQPTLGLSGVILGWAGGILPSATTQGRKQLGIWLFQIALISLLPGVSLLGHLGGFLGGLGAGALLRVKPTAFVASGLAWAALLAAVSVLAAKQILALPFGGTEL